MVLRYWATLDFQRVVSQCTPKIFHSRWFATDWSAMWPERELNLSIRSFRLSDKPFESITCIKVSNLEKKRNLVLQVRGSKRLSDQIHIGVWRVGFRPLSLKTLLGTKTINLKFFWSAIIYSQNDRQKFWRENRKVFRTSQPELRIETFADFSFRTSGELFPIVIDFCVFRNQI